MWKGLRRMPSSILTQPDIPLRGTKSVAHLPPNSRIQAQRRRHDGVAVFATGAALTTLLIVAMAMGSGQLILLAGLAIVGVSVLSPSTGLVALAMVASLKAPVDIPAPGLNSLLVGGILVGSLFRLPLERPRVKMSVSLFLLIGFVIYVVAQQIPDMLGGWAGEIGHLVGYQLFQLLTGFGAIIATALVVNGRHPWPYLLALVLSATFAAALALVSYGHVDITGPVANLVQAWTDPTRAVGPFGNPNYLGQFMATAVVLAAGLAVGHQAAVVRMAALLSLPLVGAGLAVSLSRGAVLAAFAGVLLLAIARGRRAALVVIALGTPFAIAAYELLLSGRVGESPTVLGGAGAALEASTEGRLATVLEGPRLFLTDPVFGIGFGRYSFESATGLAAHNWYSNVLAEQGLFGILAWCGVLIAVAVALRVRPVDPRSVGFGMLGAVVIGSLFLELPTSFQAAALPALVTTMALAGDWLKGVDPAATTDRPPGGAPVVRRSRITAAGVP